MIQLLCIHLFRNSSTISIIITGGIELIGGDANNTIQFRDGASKEHYTLCRCGASNNKPFCDAMHKVINFKDDKN
jgi:CDGSH-type Zn-finger protein